MNACNESIVTGEHIVRKKVNGDFRSCLKTGPARPGHALYTTAVEFDQFSLYSTGTMTRYDRLSLYSDFTACIKGPNIGFGSF